ncbi:hypothetical protein ABT121_42130 [Streptomyces sp. NPDC001928]|uniref:hypothetical protein n=1 Tax=Streptomyces sp. NPDC001928 TaxID=3154404 RepID=UPI0033239482
MSSEMYPVPWRLDPERLAADPDICGHCHAHTTAFVLNGQWVVPVRHEDDCPTANDVVDPMPSFLRAIGRAIAG